MRNVVVIIADDYPPRPHASMPYLNSEPGGSWVRFSNGITSTPLCGPSRSSYLTGLYALNHGNVNNTIGEDVVNANWDDSIMLAPALKRAGVYTAHVGKYINGYPWAQEGEGGFAGWRPEGWDSWRVANTTGYYNWDQDDNGTFVTYGSADADYRTDVEAAQVVDLVTDAPQPFFVSWTPKSPHSAAGEQFPPAPRHAAAEVTAWTGDNFNPADVSGKPTWLRTSYPNQLSSGTVDTYTARQENSLRMLLCLDEAIEDVITALTARGILEETVIIVYGDNSNLFGQHRHYSKGVPYEEAIAMNMMVRWPGHAGATSDALVSNIDLCPTICDIFGARPMYTPDGMSMVPLLDGTLDADSWREELLISRDVESPNLYFVTTYRGLRTRTEKYVEYADGTGDVEWYDVAADPFELTNKGVNADLSARLAVLEAQTG